MGPVVLALVGLYCLLLPRRFFLMGSRWQLVDGHRAEPSDAWVLVTRLIGVGFLIGAVASTFWVLTWQAERDTRESLEAAWGCRDSATNGRSSSTIQGCSG